MGEQVNNNDQIDVEWVDITFAVNNSGASWEMWVELGVSEDELHDYL